MIIIHPLGWNNKQAEIKDGICDFYQMVKLPPHHCLKNGENWKAEWVPGSRERMMEEVPQCTWPVDLLYLSSLFIIDAQLGSLESPWTVRRSNQSVLNIHWKDWCWNWNSNTLATRCEELTHWKRPWCWERLKAKREGCNRGWDSWITSPTQWT